MPEWSGSGEDSLPALRLLTSFHILTGGEQRKGKRSHSYKGTNPILEDSALMTSSNANYLPEAPPPNTVTSAGVGFQHTHLEGRGETAAILFFIVRRSRQALLYPTHVIAYLLAHLTRERPQPGLQLLYLSLDPLLTSLILGPSACLGR